MHLNQSTRPSINKHDQLILKSGPSSRYLFVSGSEYIGYIFT